VPSCRLMLTSFTESHCRLCMLKLWGEAAQTITDDGKRFHALTVAVVPFLSSAHCEYKMIDSIISLRLTLLNCTLFLKSINISQSVMQFVEII